MIRTRNELKIVNSSIYFKNWNICLYWLKNVNAKVTLREAALIIYFVHLGAAEQPVNAS